MGVLFRTDTYAYCTSGVYTVSSFLSLSLLDSDCKLLNKVTFCTFDAPPPTPISLHYTGDPDLSFAEVSETGPNMAREAVFRKLPEIFGDVRGCHVHTD